MMLDNSLVLVPVGLNFSVVGAAGQSIPTPGTIDLLGQGVGTAPANIIGTAAVFGGDFGIGKFKTELQGIVGTAFATANGAAPEFVLQGAADTGSAGGYQPGTWEDLVTTGLMAVSNLGASAVFARFDFPPAFPVTLRPRYIRGLMRFLAGTNLSAGTIASMFVVIGRDDTSQRSAARNYSVA